MVLLLKHWKSRASPGIEARAYIGTQNPFTLSRPAPTGRSARKAERPPDPGSSPGEESQGNGCSRRRLMPDNIDAGWSSPVARQAHNLKVVGSNPTPATNTNDIPQSPDATAPGLCAFSARPGASIHLPAKSRRQPQQPRAQAEVLMPALHATDRQKNGQCPPLDPLHHRSAPSNCRLKYTSCIACKRAPCAMSASPLCPPAVSS